ncbi:hypothetical protein DPMN_117670 [Dreissena polymorpha]|uniref:Uncharacterized protein n=1 Tax=Dreissena polymorpha TaxID=45954 RepID=A0A9D4GIN1_DREPO|nr:hypothetical protein DPMN_117670 [Dreissena polymorpha]
MIKFQADNLDNLILTCKVVGVSQCNNNFHQVLCIGHHNQFHRELDIHQHKISSNLAAITSITHLDMSILQCL